MRSLVTNRPTAVQILHLSTYCWSELNEYVISSGSWRCLECIKDEWVEAVTGAFVWKWFRCLFLLRHLFQDAFVWFQLFSCTAVSHGCLSSWYSSLFPSCGTLGLAWWGFFMLSGRDIHYLWGRPSELWVRQNRTGPLLLQSPAGQGPVPLDGSIVSFSCSAQWGQMDTLQKDGKNCKWFYFELWLILQILSNDFDRLWLKNCSNFIWKSVISL